MDAKDKIICSTNSRMDSILKRLAKIPDGRSILIIGPTGTDKELLAEHIHESSSRSNGPFIKVNCTGLTDTLADSQLFGHTKGAFTGATNNMDGFIQAAKNGTLFLDEIGNMPKDLQAKLLRVLENGTFQKLGENKETEIPNVRFISATNKFGKMIIDLRERFQHFIRVPPLNKRPYDIPHLLAHFMTGTGFKAVDLTALLCLSATDLEGNVRELRRFVDEAEISRDVMIEDKELSRGTLLSETLSLKIYMRHVSSIKRAVKSLTDFEFLRFATTFDKKIEEDYPDSLLPFTAREWGIDRDWALRIDNETGLTTAEKIINRYKDLLNEKTKEQIEKLLGNPTNEEIGIKGHSGIYLKSEYMYRPPALRKWDIFGLPWKKAKKRFHRAYIVDLLNREHTTEKELYDIAGVEKKTWGEWKKKFPGTFDIPPKGNPK